MDKKIENPIITIQNIKEIAGELGKWSNGFITAVMNEIFPLSDGQECKIYKSKRLWDEIGEDEVVYIPDIYLNEIYKLWYATENDTIESDTYDILINECHTKRDFEMIGGDRAEELFNFVDWQHPNMDDLTEGDDE